jgi:hypothetical protein
MLIAAAAGSLILIWRMLAKFVNKTQSHAFYHGTSVSSGLALLNGDPLNVEIAEQLKIDGPPGFYLATSSTDAEYFAARRSPGTILKYMIAGSALQTLTMQGAIVDLCPQAVLLEVSKAHS